MARFTHTVTLDSVPQQWFHRLIRTGHDRAQGLLADINIGLEITSWDPHADTAGRLTLTDETMELSSQFVLRTAAAPATVACDGQVHLTEPKQPSFLRTTSWTAQAEIDRWWKGSGHIKVAVHNKIAQGDVKFAPDHVDARVWQLKVTTKVRGRSWARPLIAIALLFLRAKLDKKIGEALQKAADRWHADVPELIKKDPDAIIDVVALKLQEAEAQTEDPV